MLLESGLNTSRMENAVQMRRKWGWELVCVLGDSDSSLLSCCLYTVSLQMMRVLTAEDTVSPAY